ncbi:MAG: hypothetical protein PVH18_13185, partial [Chloroflexota bacterium]
MKQKILVLVVILFAVLATAIPALAAAPAEGTVYEGVRVPGIALGDSRTEVEASYGPPISCVNYNEPNDMAACKFDVEGGGTVSVQYRGPNGGSPSGSPDDVAAAISWPQVVEGWVTTAGINTTKALDQDVVVAAYPNADLYYDSVGRLYYLRDPELGISVAWNFLYFYTASMTIFEP